ncbi:zinc finger protein 629-like [Penaeus japonicus]|uniref:zinc finger protein 629-like n=1 Tax=Penaeus japonicus TaxID=27405 RepID=UPI001C715D59|nr:zinc finger protein 629-like [Penaeus japonicus]
MTKRSHLTPDDSCLPLKKRRNLGQSHVAAHSASFAVPEPPTTPEFMFSPITHRTPATYFFRPWCSPETPAPAIPPNNTGLWTEGSHSGRLDVSNAPCTSESLVVDTNDSGISESSADSSLEGSPLQTPIAFSPYTGDLSRREDSRSVTPIFESQTPLSVHGESRFDCEDCGRKFKKRAYLVRHRRLHTGERPYSCDICSATFSQMPNLWYHKRIHTGESPYECAVCQRKFRSSSHLKRHQRLHTGETPYACPSCPAAFITWDKLNRHKMIDHQ